LGHQFGVGVVAIAAHRIRHHRRKQAFERGQYCHRKRRRQQRQDQIRAKLRNMDGRQRAADAAEFTANGFDWQLKHASRHGCRQQRDNRAGHSRK